MLYNYIYKVNKNFQSINGNYYAVSFKTLY